MSFNRGATERVEFLRQLRTVARAAGVEIRVTVQTGPVDEIILLHARARQVDLIVVGTARNNEARRGLSGWIAERVLRDAPCPTLVVPPASEAEPTATRPILCAVDFSPASHAAAQTAVQMSAGGRHSVTLLHVVDRGGSGQSSVRRWIGATEYDRAVTADALSKLRFMIPPPQRGAVEARVAIGEPASEILSMADALKPELLVIGAEARTRLGSRLFGKTAQLIRDSACPILAVPALKAARAHDEKVTRLAA
jgi:nucleotide-binding universal stress UspA family protein